MVCFHCFEYISSYMYLSFLIKWHFPSLHWFSFNWYLLSKNRAVVSLCSIEYQFASSTWNHCCQLICMKCHKWLHCISITIFFHIVYVNRNYHPSSLLMHCTLNPVSIVQSLLRSYATYVSAYVFISLIWKVLWWLPQ